VKSSLAICCTAQAVSRCHMSRNAGCAKEAFLRKARADLSPAKGWYGTC
jgi:hypothetical protein